MVNEIIDGIAKAIKTEYKSCSIYVDEVKQGLKRPCFFIALIDALQEQKLDNRLWREHIFDVHYFPAKNAPVREINSVIDTLRTSLLYISVVDVYDNKANLVRGTEMRHEIVDGVLHFFVNYNLFVLVPPENNPYMETIGVDVQVKQ